MSYLYGRRISFTDAPIAGNSLAPSCPEPKGPTETKLMDAFASSSCLRQALTVTEFMAGLDSSRGYGNLFAKEKHTLKRESIEGGRCAQIREAQAARN